MKKGSQVANQCVQGGSGEEKVIMVEFPDKWMWGRGTDSAEKGGKVSELHPSFPSWCQQGDGDFVHQ